MLDLQTVLYALEDVLAFGKNQPATPENYHILTRKVEEVVDRLRTRSQK